MVEIDTFGFMLLLVIFPIIGIAADEIFRLIGRIGRYIIAEVYQERGEEYFLIKRKKVGLGAEMFNVGEHQFAVDPEKVRFYNSNHPVLQYDLRDSRPPRVRIKPFDVTVTREPKPSSATTNMIYRRGGLRAMMQATKSVTMNPLMVAIFAAVAGLAAGVLLMQFWHPGLVNGPPPGFYYEPKPVFTPGMNGTR